MDFEDWIDIRRCKDDVEEFEVVELCFKSVMKWFKELVWEKIFKMKNKFF